MTWLLDSGKSVTLSEQSLMGNDGLRSTSLTPFSLMSGPPQIDLSATHLNQTNN